MRATALGGQTLACEGGLAVLGSKVIVGGTGLFGDGSVSVPSMAFASEPGLGWYRVGPAEMGFAVGGALSLRFDSGGIIKGAAGQIFTMNSSGAFSLAANGTNQSIILTPSGTGHVNIGPSSVTVPVQIGADSTATTYGAISFVNDLSPTGKVGFAAVASGDNNFYAQVPTGWAYKWRINNVDKAMLATSGNLLLGGLTTDGTGRLQLPLGASSAADGITLGAQNIYSGPGYGGAGAGAVQFDGAGIVGNNAGNFWSLSGGAANLRIDSAGGIILRTNGTTAALTLDSSQNATFAGTTLNLHGAAAAASTGTKFIKSVTGIADNSATTVLTITVPNAAHSAGVRVRMVASLGAGGAIGANEASQVITYDIGVTRTAGVAMNAVISTAFGSSTSVAVAGAATINAVLTITLSGEGVGVTNTASVKATIAHGSGSSTNHTCVLLAEVLNANASGITIA